MRKHLVTHCRCPSKSKILGKFGLARASPTLHTLQCLVGWSNKPDCSLACRDIPYHIITEHHHSTQSVYMLPMIIYMQYICKYTQMSLVHTYIYSNNIMYTRAYIEMYRASLTRCCSGNCAYNAYELPCLRSPDTKKSLGVKKSSYDVVCAAKSSISTCFRCAKNLCLIGRTSLPIAQSIEATIVDWDGYYYYIYIYIYIYTYIHTNALRDHGPRLPASPNGSANMHSIGIPCLYLPMYHMYLYSTICTMHLRMYVCMYSITIVCMR